MSGITNYGPLNKPGAASQAKGRIAEHKEKKAAVPLKFRVQEATMRVSRAITEGSFATAQSFYVGALLPPIAIAAAIVGAVSLGVQKIVEAQFGKSIDLSKDKRKQLKCIADKAKELDYIAHLSKARIDQNVRRGVIDKPTGEILKTLKRAIKEALPKIREYRQLENENARLKYQLYSLKAMIVEKKDVSFNYYSSRGHSQEIKKINSELKYLNHFKMETERGISSITKKINDLKPEIQAIKDDYSNELTQLAETRKSKINEKVQHKQDKSLLHLEKSIDKKYKFKPGFSTELKAEIFFEEEYTAYEKRCKKSKTDPITKDEFIKKYYEKKGIDYETEVL
jgi:gas vesicle protein